MSLIFFGIGIGIGIDFDFDFDFDFVFVFVFFFDATGTGFSALPSHFLLFVDVFIISFINGTRDTIWYELYFYFKRENKIKNNGSRIKSTARYIQHSVF